jgi:hypothetical protein
MRKKLTAKTVENLPEAQGRRYEVWDLALPSFGVRIAPSGRKTWFVTCRISGRLRQRKIGTYPALSLLETRELARKFLGDVQRGKYQNDSAPVPTLGDTVPEFIERYLSRFLRSYRDRARGPHCELHAVVRGAFKSNSAVGRKQFRLRRCRRSPGPVGRNRSVSASVTLPPAAHLSGLLTERLQNVCGPRPRSAPAFWPAPHWVRRRCHGTHSNLRQRIARCR